jgi:MFS family permease
MASQVRHPIWLPVLRAPGARTFASLYAIESFARALVASVIPIQAYELLHSEQKVSLLYTVVSVFALLVTLTIPMLIGVVARRWVYSLGALLLIIAAVAFLTNSLPGQVLGMLARAGGAGALAITLNLYIMDHIRKTDFVHSESLRMAWSTLGWTGGPAAGVLLYTNFGLLAAHGVSALCSVALLALFWYYRLSENSLIRPGKTKPANPLKNIGRFVSQPRLRLAWLIAFGRSCFWTTFFVYGPILMVVSGEGKLAGGLLVSAGNALLFTAIWWGRVGRRFGSRRIMALAFLAMTATLFLAGAAGESLPLLAAAFLLICTFFAISLDALGSNVFFRAVKPRERAEMTSIYRTYLDLSDLLPPLVYSVVLGFFGLGATFVTLGVFCAICGVITWRYVPKSM